MNIRGPFPQRREDELLSPDEFAEKEWRDVAAFKGYIVSLFFWISIALLILYFGGIQPILQGGLYLIIIWIFSGLLGRPILVLWVMNPFGKIFRLKADYDIYNRKMEREKVDDY